MKKKSGKKKTREEIEEELIAAEEGLFTKKQVLEHLKKFVEYHKTQVKAAEVLGVSQQYLSDILKGSRSPGPKILIGLGFKKEYRYVSREVLNQV